MRWIGLLLMVVLLTSCKNEGRQTLSDEQNKLSLRFFNAVHKGEHAAAADQANKLYLLDPSGEFLLRLASQQKGYATVSLIQQELNRGDLAKATAILDRAQKEEPFNRQLAKIRSSLRQLERTEKWIQAMKAAKTPPEKAEALRVAKAGLGTTTASPILTQYLEQYQNQIAESTKP